MEEGGGIPAKEEAEKSSHYLDEDYITSTGALGDVGVLQGTDMSRGTLNRGLIGGSVRRGSGRGGRGREGLDRREVE